jgi:RNA polymerase sigma factor (sigma-70 family)
MDEILRMKQSDNNIQPEKKKKKNFFFQIMNDEDEDKKQSISNMHYQFVHLAVREEMKKLSKTCDVNEQKNILLQMVVEGNNNVEILTEDNVKTIEYEENLKKLQDYSVYLVFKYINFYRNQDRNALRTMKEEYTVNDIVSVCFLSLARAIKRYTRIDPGTSFENYICLQMHNSVRAAYNKFRSRGLTRSTPYCSVFSYNEAMSGDNTDLQEEIYEAEGRYDPFRAKIDIQDLSELIEYAKCTAEEKRIIEAMKKAAESPRGGDLNISEISRNLNISYSTTTRRIDAIIKKLRDAEKCIKKVTNETKTKRNQNEKK